LQADQTAQLAFEIDAIKKASDTAVHDLESDGKTTISAAKEASAPISLKPRNSTKRW
jgi:hypothetical protein